MKEEEKKYERILRILRDSKPVLSNPEDIEENVIRKIQKPIKSEQKEFDFFDYLFGWVYIGWVRTGLVAASVLIISVFAYQQSLILKRINTLEKQTIISGNQFVTETNADVEEKMMLYKLTGRKLPKGNITVSEKKMKQFMNSYNELQDKYKDLVKIIEENPELKKLIEEKLSEKNKKKFNM
ncbi:MAG: hypothetical protein NTZ85_12675 [Bacteroidia bacterium]|nr:hypothetical protein [Bacteroidia bacterium]